MPRAYEKMRDKFVRDGLGYDAAQEKAARIYNSKHKDAPVTGKSDQKGRKKKRKKRPQPLPMPKRKNE